MTDSVNTSLAPIEQIILAIRNQRVILDADLARLYGVPTGVLNQAVKRNISRFPEDFMLVLTRKELTDLKSQFVISSWGGRRTLPYAFTEHGALMAANVLNSDRAVEMSVYVIRAFVRLRETLVANKDLANRLAAVEQTLEKHDDSIKALVSAIRQLMTPPPAKRKRIGFIKDEPDTSV